jgi:DNA (cytosine-5)-methyltransferase 1
MQPHPRNYKELGLKRTERLELRSDEKSNTCCARSDKNLLPTELPKYRKLTPKECMRLQGFTEEIIDKLLNAGISNSQLYKMTGNSFTLPVIIHNLQQLLDTGWPDNL